MTAQTLKSHSEWTETKLGDICEFNSSSIGKNYPFSEIEYIDISSVGTGVLNEKTKYELSKAPGRAKRIIKNGDTIVSNVRPNRRSFVYLKNPKENDIASTGFTVVSPIVDLADSRFIYYIISDQKFTDYLTKHAKGAAYPAVDTSTFKNAAILLPSLEKQKKIADILGAYDDLIEINNKKIKILEEIAQTIYKEWFVKPTKNGLPDGWEVKTLGEVVINFDSKRKPISKMKREEISGEFPYYGAAKIIDRVNNYIFDGKYLLFAEDGSVITSTKTPVLQFVNEKFWVSNHAHILQGKLVSTEYLYLTLSNFNISGYMTGVAQPKITQENMNRIQILTPENTVREVFDKQVIPFFEEIWNVEKQNKNLQKTRDLLIPQLVGGKISLK